MLHETVSALRSLFAAYIAGVFKIEEDQFKKFLGDMLRLGDLIGQHQIAAKFLAKPNQRLQGIFAFLRYHKPGVVRLRRVLRYRSYNKTWANAKATDLN